MPRAVRSLRGTAVTSTPALPISVGSSPGWPLFNPRSSEADIQEDLK
jgi:hypothetical protein